MPLKNLYPFVSKSIKRIRQQHSLVVDRRSKFDPLYSVHFVVPPYAAIGTKFSMASRKRISTGFEFLTVKRCCLLCLLHRQSINQKEMEVLGLPIKICQSFQTF